MRDSEYQLESHSLSFTSTKDPVVNHLQPKSVTSSPSPYYLLRQCVNIDQHIANRSSGR